MIFQPFQAYIDEEYNETGMSPGFPGGMVPAGGMGSLLGYQQQARVAAAAGFPLPSHAMLPAAMQHYMNLGLTHLNQASLMSGHYQGVPAFPGAQTLPKMGSSPSSAPMQSHPNPGKSTAAIGSSQTINNTNTTSQSPQNVSAHTDGMLSPVKGSTVSTSTTHSASSSSPKMDRTMPVKGICSPARAVSGTSPTPSTSAAVPTESVSPKSKDETQTKSSSPGTLTYSIDRLLQKEEHSEKITHQDNEDRASVTSDTSDFKGELRSMHSMMYKLKGSTINHQEVHQEKKIGTKGSPIKKN